MPNLALKAYADLPNQIVQDVFIEFWIIDQIL